MMVLKNATIETFEGRVLVVEDEEVNRMVAAGIMANFGIDPDFAVSGAQAIEKLSTQQFDLIFMDVQMLEMDGIEATIAIREQERAENRTRTPIIALTANTTNGDRERCIESGMDDFVSKPLFSDDLRIVFDQWLAMKKPDPIDNSAGASAANFDDTLDPTVLKILGESMASTPGGLRRILESYLESLDRLNVVVGKGADQGNLDVLARTAHSLKSNSAVAGALVLSALCADLELQVGEGTIRRQQELFLQIENEVSRVKIAVEAELNKLPTQETS